MVGQEQFDIDCLRGIATDAEAQRIALAAAMIKLHALSIAREIPTFRDEALEIVGYAQQLYAHRTTRQTIDEIVRKHLVRSSGPAAIESLVDALWTRISTGRA